MNEELDMQDNASNNETNASICKQTSMSPFTLRGAKPGGFQTRVFPTFSGKGQQIVSQTLSGLFLVGALNRPRQRKRTNQENPRRVPEQIGKIPEQIGKVPKRTKKDKKSRSGNTPV